MTGTPFLLGMSAQSKPSNTPEYTGVLALFSGNTIEANNKHKIPFACTVDQMRVYVDASGTGRTWISRINAADGALNPTITDSTAGAYGDLTHSDSLSAGDLYDIKRTVAVTSTATFYWQTAQLVGSSGQVGLYRANGTPIGASVNTTYAPISGATPAAGTRAQTEIEIQTPGTFSKLGLNLNSDGCTGGDLTVTFYINGSPGNQTFVVPAGSAQGWYEDSAHSDTVAAGDLVCIQLANAATGGTAISMNFYQVAFQATSGSKADYFQYGKQSRTASATVHCMPAVGGILNLSSTSTTERRAILPFACTLSNFGFRASANTYTGDCLVKLWKNGSLVITLTVSAGVTTLVKDTSTTVSFAVGDDFHVTIEGGTANSITSAYFMYTLDGATAVTVALTGNASTASEGTLGVKNTQTLTGNSSTADRGTLAPKTAVALTGNASTAGRGTLAPKVTVALTGNAMTASEGTLTPSTSGNVTVALTGISMTMQQGTLTAVAPSALGTGGHFIPLTEKQLREQKKRERRDRQLRDDLDESRRLDAQAIEADMRATLAPKGIEQQNPVNYTTDGVDSDEDEAELELLLLHA